MRNLFPIISAQVTATFLFMPSEASKSEGPIAAYVFEVEAIPMDEFYSPIGQVHSNALCET